jgi:uncharacterized protein YbjT (DUF2867 family)
MILVTGATGQVGSQLIPQLLERNVPVRALTRDPGKLAHWGNRIETIASSFDQPDTLLAAMQGVERMFLMSAGVGAGQVEAAMQAAKQAGVRHVVFLSSMGADDPTLLIGKWHHDREAAIRASGLAWTFLRPGYFMSNTFMWVETIKTQGAVYVPGSQGQFAPIDPQDIAAVAAVALTQPGHGGQIYELTGPELMTTGEQVEILARVLDKPLRYVDVPPDAAREEMIKSGMPAIFVEAMTQLFTRMREGRGAIKTDTFEQVVGRKPRTFAAWCRDHIAAFQ